MGVLKTKNGSAIFNNRLSWFIYTPTKKLRITKKNSHFLTFYTNFILYRTQYRKTLLKSTLSPITQPKSQLTIQTTFFLYKYKNPKKIHTFTDYQFFIKNHINNKKIILISNSKREYKHVDKITSIKHSNRKIQIEKEITL